MAAGGIDRRGRCFDVLGADLKPIASIMAVCLAGCAAEPVFSPLAAIPIPPPSDARRKCPPVAAHVMALAEGRVEIPSTISNGPDLTGTAVISDIERRQALLQMIRMYGRCRSAVVK